MKAVEFNPFVSSLIKLAFNCDECGATVETDYIGVPAPDYSADTIHESETGNSDSVICMGCTKQFDIFISCDYGGGGIVEISNLNENTDVKVISFPETEWDAILSNRDFLDTFQEEIENLRKLNQLKTDDFTTISILKRQIFIGAVTCMETYLSDAFINTILSKREFLKKFYSTYKDFKSRKICLSEIHDYIDKADQIAKVAMLEVLYHNLPKVNEMYKDTLDIDLPTFGDINKAVSKRHDLVHRSGKTKDGDEILVSQADVDQVINMIEDFVRKIDMEIRKRYS